MLMQSTDLDAARFIADALLPRRGLNHAGSDAEMMLMMLILSGLAVDIWRRRFCARHRRRIPITQQRRSSTALRTCQRSRRTDRVPRSQLFDL